MVETAAPDLARILTAPSRRHPFAPVWRMWAFVVRGFHIWWSYKLWVLLDVVGMASMVTVYYLLSFIVTPRQVAAAGYGASYFAFALIGIAYSQFVWASVQSLSRSLREEQWMGTLETLYSSAKSFASVLFGESAYRFLEAALFLLLAFGAGLLLGAPAFAAAGPAVAAAALLTLLLVASHLVFGLLSAAVVLKVKEGDPVVWAFTWGNNLLAGVLYPLAVLPGWLQAVAWGFPLSHALDGIRRALLQGETLASPVIQGDAAFLLLFSIIGLPLAYGVFRLSAWNVRRRGEMGHY